MGYHRGNIKAQNFVEYTLVLGIVGLALFGMQAYFKRGIQSVIKVTADDFGQQGEPFRKFEDDEARTKATVEDQRTTEAAIRAKYYPDGHKYSFTSSSTEDVTIQNQGSGNIVRTINKGETISDDVSH